MSPDSVEKDPHLFRGNYISEELVAAGMAGIVKRQMYLPLNSPRSLDAQTISMTAFDEAADINEELIKDMIRGVMVGPEICDDMKNANQAVVVYEKRTPVGVALLRNTEGSSMGDLWLRRHDFYDGPGVSVLSFGAMTNPKGLINQYVFECLAKEIIIGADELASTLHPLFGMRGEKEFTPTLQLQSHGSIPTILAADFQKRLNRVMSNLHAIAHASTATGSGFPTNVAYLSDGILELQQNDPAHAITKAFTELAPMKMLNYNNIRMGGDTATYANMKKIAATMQECMKAVLKGLHDAFLQLYPPTAPVASANIVSGEDQQGNVTVEIGAKGHATSVVTFSPQLDEDPVVHFVNPFPNTASDLSGELLKKVVGGRWWGEKMSKSV